MALINCPECKNKISEKAPTCPNCGYQLNTVKTDLHQTMNEGGLFAISILAATFISAMVCGYFEWRWGVGFTIICVLGSVFFITLTGTINKK